MNPFRVTIVSDPWRTSAMDVPEIQASVFLDCLQGIAHVRRSNQSAALLIHGGAGSGKTHLLGRLRTQLILQAPSATDRDECLFVWIRLQTSPRMIWRHVRRTLVEDWFRPIRGQSTQFARILFRRLAEIRVAEGDLEPWYEYMLENHPAGLDELLDRVAESLYLDRNTTIAFKHLAFGRHLRDLRAWLGGDSLPEEALARLDLSQEEGTDEEREHEARRTVLMLCRLAGDSLPIVLSLDQVEALQTSAADRDGLFAFGQLVSTLHDETSNVFIVACVQSAFATELKDKSRGADYDRMTSLGARSLSTLTRTEAEKLIAMRRKMAEPGLPLPVAVDPLWPLESADYHRLAAVDELTPRRLLATCADRFDTWFATTQSSISMRPMSHDSDLPSRRDLDFEVSIKKLDADFVDQVAQGRTMVAPDQPPEAALELFLSREWTTRKERCESGRRSERTEEILRHGMPELIRLLPSPWKITNDKLLPDVHLILDGPTGEVGISVCAHSNMRTVGEQFKRLKSQWSLKRLTRLVIIQDELAPLSKGAKVAKQWFDELVAQGVQVMIPSAEILINLDALRDLMSNARSGDLAHRGESVLPQVAEECLKKLIPHCLRQFVEELTKVSS